MQNDTYKVYRKKVNCSIDSLKEVREFVGSVLAQYNLKEGDANLMILAVDEVCCNRMEHSHGCNPNESLELVIYVDVSPRQVPHQLIFEIRDKGEIFNIVDYAVPTIEQIIKERKRGNIGLGLVKKIMDKIQIDKREGISVCRMIKEIGGTKAI
ncbi:MAG: ATP-binding protein [Cytophagales bacterium]|nr:ATP-binding protein [Cytophagales bacterium]MDW8384478.1 ATP-binding protein [Flammeovirgaceae bacterium]